MQVYRELRVLTARPTPAGGSAASRTRLYGVRPAAEPGSVAWWRGEALAAMDAARDAGRLPILTGGTGLYFASLTDGLCRDPRPRPGGARRGAAPAGRRSARRRCTPGWRRSIRRPRRG